MRNLIGCLWIVTSLGGCVTSVDTGCVDDSECYSGRVCVSGRCQGEVAVNNELVNNASNNTTTNGRPDESPSNNMTPPPNNISGLCTTSDECDRSLVCAPGIGEAPVLDCRRPWDCVSFVEQDDATCVLVTDCVADGPYEAFCDFGDADVGRCACVGSTGAATEFEAQRGVCDDSQEFVDRVNRECLWRVPRP